MLLKASMVDGRTDLGVMPSGQVAGVTDDLPSCTELVDRLVTDARAVIHALPTTDRPHHAPPHSSPTGTFP